MKNWILYIFILGILTFGLSSCVEYRRVHTAGNSGKIPPGQMKKITGEQSAKHYAPGQRKKRMGSKHRR